MLDYTYLTQDLIKTCAFNALVVLELTNLHPHVTLFLQMMMP